MGVSAYRADTACQFLRWKTGRELRGRSFGEMGKQRPQGRCFRHHRENALQPHPHSFHSEAPRTSGDRWGTERMSDTLGMY